MDVDSEEEAPKLLKRKGKAKIIDSEEDSDEKPKKSKKRVKGKKVNEDFFKEGWVLKKKRKSMFGQWDKRYLVLDGSKLSFYLDSEKKTLNKTLDLSSGVVTGIWFHYDENAPSASKKIGQKEIDESRFDIYVKKPLPR
jgi:hypothetical protein